ncbi:EF-P 5-aminopentanol modification-associated protein YfmH [Sporosarcina highlanderae]|uniref:Pitrilysin family protein n=1 Tax=Sporosarcina highlanderae TaxID=3035916 RepID=A0ABT8JR35_9BACL|nr:pitrilysin family protein [Sporosarcina highlanderae]MDN4607402.1 pitrilysin family protein [Sporosarcina highlanderae]
MEKIVFENLQETLFHEKLDNGLSVYILPKRGFSKTYVTFTTKYGSIDRTFIPRGKKELVTVPDGIAHFLEHKMFDKKEGDVFQKFGVLGASANAFTSFTRTSYLFSTTENLYENTKVLLDFVQEPYFTEEKVEKEKGIIAQEITMYDDNPDWRNYFGTIESLYKEHPVRIDIAGTIETIEEITAEHLYECYETFYHPSNMAVFVIGAVDPDEMMNFIKEDQKGKEFSEPEEILRQFPEEPIEAATKKTVLEMDVLRPKFNFGMKCNRTDLNGEEMLRQDLAVNLVLDILFGRTSEFYTRAYKDNLIDETFHYDFTLEKGFGFATVESDTENPTDLEAAIRKTLSSQVENWTIAESDLERARKRRIGQFMRSLNSIEFISNQFTTYNFNDMNLFDVVPTLEKMTIDHLKEAFSTISSEASHTVMTIVPGAKEN